MDLRRLGCLLVSLAALAGWAQPIDNCPAFDPNHTGTVTIDELIQAVNYLLAGCP